LIAGNYSFQLQVTDSQGRIAKDSVNYQVIHDTLVGKEFVFNQTWLRFGSSIDEEIYVAITDSVLLYTNQRLMEVSIQLDGTTNWVSVPMCNWYYGQTVSNQAFYYDYFCPFCDMSGVLIEKNYPLDDNLVNKPVKVKVKFL